MTDLNLPDIQSVRDYFIQLQDSICDTLEELDGETRFVREDIPGEHGGLSRPRVLEDGPHIEKAAVQFSHSIGSTLPPAATARNPELAGHAFQAAAISLIVHPRNPFVPITHMNLRFFLVSAQHPVWYFGGGFDLTPCYGFTDDAHHWHSQAQFAAQSHYRALKQACDQYFFLPHRNECRGIGGIFFDDWTEGGFTRSFDFTRRVGDCFVPAYRPIFQRRMKMDYGSRQRQWQLVRRSRYAEFNLVVDRGTRYGLQSGRRVESVLASLPPLAAWKYNVRPEPGSPEEALLLEYLPPRDWLDVVDNSVD